MLLSKEQAAARLSNPDNLVNKIGSSKSSPAMSIFGLGAATKPTTPIAIPQQGPPVIPESPFTVNFSFNGSTKEKEDPVLISEPEIPDIPHTSQLLIPIDKEFELLKQRALAQATPDKALAASEIKPVGLDDLMEDAAAKINLYTAHNNALEVVNEGLKRLKEEIPNMKGDKIPSVIAGAIKVVESIRREKIELKKANPDGDNVHFHFYSPRQRTREEYKIIDVESHAVAED